MLLSHLKDLEVQIAFFEIQCKTLTKSHEIDKQRSSRDFLAVKVLNKDVKQSNLICYAFNVFEEINAFPSSRIKINMCNNIV